MSGSNEGKKPGSILPPRKQGLDLPAQPTAFTEALKGARAYFIQSVIVPATGEDEIRRVIQGLPRGIEAINRFVGKTVVFQGKALTDFIAGRDAGLESPTVYLVLPDREAAVNAARQLGHTGPVEGFEGLPQHFLTMPSSQLSEINLKLFAAGGESIQLNPVPSLDALKRELTAQSKGGGMAR